MFTLEMEMIVSQSNSERRTYTDRTTGQSREYLSSVLSGITCDFSTPLSLRVDEKAAPALAGLNKGDRVTVSLSSFDARRGGICEGTVCALVRHE